jgi:hypothetical protein
MWGWMCSDNTLCKWVFTVVPREPYLLRCELTGKNARPWDIGQT